MQELSLPRLPEPKLKQAEPLGLGSSRQGGFPKARWEQSLPVNWPTTTSQPYLRTDNRTQPLPPGEWHARYQLPPADVVSSAEGTGRATSRCPPRLLQPRSALHTDLTRCPTSL